MIQGPHVSKQKQQSAVSHGLILRLVPFFSFRRSARTKTAIVCAQKDREETELEIIAQKQKEMAGMLKQNKASLRKALAGQSYVPCRSAGDNLTHPQEFHFATDKRLGPINNAQCNEETEKNFVGSLRQHPPSPVSVRAGKIIIIIIIIIIISVTMHLI